MPLTPDELLTTTRAVRRRLDLSRPVPLDLVRECLEIALQAPSGSNQQSWHWVVVTDPAKRAAVGKIYRQQFDRYEESRGFAGRLFADQPERAAVQQRVGSSARWLGDHMGEVPVLVLPCVRTGGPFQAVNQAGLWGSLLPAAWSYCLAARSRGLARPGRRCISRARPRSPSSWASPPACTRERSSPPRSTPARRSGPRRANPSTPSCTSTAGEGSAQPRLGGVPRSL
jgi:nitroreductase